MTKIIAHGPLLPPVIEKLGELGEVIVMTNWEKGKHILLEHGQDVCAVATYGGIGKEQLQALPNLKIVANFGVGFDNVDVTTAHQMGVVVTNTPDVLNDAVAELTFGLVLTLSRQLHVADQYIRAGRWPLEGQYPLSRELTGATVGIIGMGRIGREFARRARAMNMRVVYHGRHEQPHVPYKFYDSPKNMAQDVDWLVLLAPGGPETYHIVNEDVLNALGPEGYLVNVGRGSLVDEEALVQAIQDRKIAGAALDVFAHEPHVPQQLIDSPHVLLTPHIGSSTTKTRAAMGQLIVDNIAMVLSNQPALTPVRL